MVADDAKVVLVTGSSRGLGKAIALEMGKAGQKVVVNYVSDGSKEGAEATCEEIKALGGDAIAVQADSTFRFVVSTPSQKSCSVLFLPFAFAPHSVQARVHCRDVCRSRRKVWHR